MKPQEGHVVWTMDPRGPQEGHVVWTMDPRGELDPNLVRPPGHIGPKNTAQPLCTDLLSFKRELK